MGSFSASVGATGASADVGCSVADTDLDAGGKLELTGVRNGNAAYVASSADITDVVGGCSGGASGASLAANS